MHTDSAIQLACELYERLLEMHRPRVGELPPVVEGHKLRATAASLRSHIQLGAPLDRCELDQPERVARRQLASAPAHRPTLRRELLLRVAKPSQPVPIGTTTRSLAPRPQAVPWGERLVGQVLRDL